MHAKTCKVKRNISLLCLKTDQNEEALAELRQVEDLERTLYGESSTQLGKTYKVIGTIHLLNKNHTEARDYLLKAQAIFEQKGLLKLLKEVKQKLKLLNPAKFNQMLNEHGGSGLNAAQMLGVAGVGAGGMAGMESDGDDGLGDVASPEQMAVRKGGKLAAKKKKKSAGPGGQQRKVINNYMDGK